MQASALGLGHRHDAFIGSKQMVRCVDQKGRMILTQPSKIHALNETEIEVVSGGVDPALPIGIWDWIPPWRPPYISIDDEKPLQD
jgi:hypothetical protein